MRKSEIKEFPSLILNDSDPSPTECTLIHSYPGSMPAFLASRLAERYSSKNDIIFDPFCGSGVVLVEGVRLGRKVIGTDLLDIPIDIANSALALPEPERMYKTWKEMHIKSLKRVSLFAESAFSYDHLSDGHKNLSRWLHNETFAEVISINEEIRAIVDKGTRRLFSLLLAGTLISLSKRVSRGVLHWGWIADNVLPDKQDLIKTSAFDEVEKRVLRLTRFIKATGSGKSLDANGSLIFVHDWTKGSLPMQLSNKTVDLLLTSPPYPYSIDYTLALRLTYYLLDKPFDGIRSNEIGARYKRKRKDRDDQYLNELGSSITLTAGLVKPSGHAVFVLPHPDEYRSVIDYDTDEWLDYFLGCMGGAWHVAEVGVRDCSQRRLIHRSKATRRELVVAFAKDL